MLERAISDARAAIDELSRRGASKAPGLAEGVGVPLGKFVARRVELARLLRKSFVKRSRKRADVHPESDPKR